MEKLLYGQYLVSSPLAPWCSGYHYCTTSFNNAWTQVLRWFKSFSRRVGDSRWWGSLTMVPAGNKSKSLSSVNHTTKAIHHQFITLPLNNVEKQWAKLASSYVMGSQHCIGGEGGFLNTLFKIPIFCHWFWNLQKKKTKDEIQCILFQITHICFHESDLNLLKHG